MLMKSQRGISLVEALVALVVLSVGMLGIAGMFVESVRSSRTALLRTQAVNLVSDMADRIRANANARTAYDTSTYGDAPAKRGCAPTSEDDGNNCGIAELAEDDLARWREAVDFALPVAASDDQRAVVEYFAPEPNGPERYRVTVFWGEPGTAITEETSQASAYSYSSDVILMPRPGVT